jgi:hypothetical protein
MIEWHELLQGGNTSRTVLQMVIIAVSLSVGNAAGAVYGAQMGALAGMAVNLVGNMLLNVVLPIKQAGQQGTLADQSPASVYNVSTSANQARLGQPIPVIYGRQPVFPDYAAQPYIEYIHNPLLNGGKGGGDQYLFVPYSADPDTGGAPWFADLDEVTP